MDSEKEQYEKLRLADLAFFGRIMANISHEFNNVITIIGELSGLLQDLSVLAEQGKPIKADKLKKVTENITRHIARGKELISNMNQLSHSVDEQRKEVKLQDIISNMKILTKRLLERKLTQLSWQPTKDDIRITTDPFAIRHALFACLELAMMASSSAPALSMRIQQRQETIDIIISNSNADSSLEDEKILQELLLSVNRLGGTVSQERNDKGAQIKLNIPKHLEISR